MKKQPCDPLFMVLHEAHISFGQTEESETEREREIKRGKRGGGEEGDRVCLCTPCSAPALYFCFLFLCMVDAHTLTVQWIFNLALISCVPDETNTDSLFTFVKAPAAAVLVPHTQIRTHTLTHTQPLNQRPRPSWGLQEEPTLHKMALAALSCTLLLHSLTHTHARTHMHRVCHVSLDRTTLQQISARYLGHYTPFTLLTLVYRA